MSAEEECHWTWGGKRSNRTVYISRPGPLRSIAHGARRSGAPSSSEITNGPFICDPLARHWGGGGGGSRWSVWEPSTTEATVAPSGWGGGGWTMTQRQRASPIPLQSTALAKSSHRMAPEKNLGTTDQNCLMLRLSHKSVVADITPPPTHTLPRERATVKPRNLMPPPAPC